MAVVIKPPHVPVDRPKELGNVCYKVKTHIKTISGREPELTYTGYYKNDNIREKTIIMCQRKAKMHNHLFHDIHDVFFTTIPWCEACRHGRIEIKNHKTGGYDVQSIE